MPNIYYSKGATRYPYINGKYVLCKFPVLVYPVTSNLS
jgi:hypothetical protein